MDGTQSKIFFLFFTVFVLVTLLLGCGSESGGTLQRENRLVSLGVTPFPAFDFGNVFVGSTQTQTFTLTNLSTSDITDLTGEFYLSINFQYLGGSFPGTGGTCTSTLPAQSSCEVVVAFVPQYAGSFKEALRVSYQDAAGARTTDSPLIYGTGRVAP